MKIFYIAVHEQNAGWGAEWFVNKGFLTHGHETITLDYRKHRSSLDQMFKQITDFDVLFLQRGDHFPLHLLEAVQRPKVFWASELVSRRRDQDRLFVHGNFDHVFTHSPDCLETVAEKRWVPAERMSVLLNGFDQETHYRNTAIERDIDVLFVGSMTSRRQEIIDQIGRKVVIRVESAFGQAMSNLFRRAKIVLNIHASGMLDVETRTFEALGCGAFVLTEPLDTFSPFKNGEHLVECSVDEMADYIKHYLTHEAERVRIAEQGHLEAVQKHTYKARSKEIADVLQRCVDAKQSQGPALLW